MNQQVEGHTPIPWKFIKHSQGEWLGNIRGSYGLVDGIENIRTISCQTKYGSIGEAEANAEFICYAVNNIERLEKVNEALVEALEVLKRSASGYVDVAYIDLADSALKLAKETA